MVKLLRNSVHHSSAVSGIVLWSKRCQFSRQYNVVMHAGVEEMVTVPVGITTEMLTINRF